MYTIRKQFKFEMAHQLKDAYSKSCTNLHGHSYIVEVFFQSRDLDETGMVIDFGQVSDLIKDYIDTYWDHALVMPNNHDKSYLKVLAKHNKKLRVVNYNPTAENMSRVIYEEVRDILSEGNMNCNLVQKVRVHETATGWAEYHTASGVLV